MPRKSTRRTFMCSVGAAGLAMPLVHPPLVRAASVNGKLRHVGFGAGGMAWGDLNALAAHPRFSLHAVCDVDERNLVKVREKFPDVRTYSDFRVLIEKESEHFESANVSTPDHMHAPIAMSLIRRGKHVYCQKPLTHDVYESRQLRRAADEAGVVTQMGIQVHSALPYRLGVHLIQSGLIGRVREVHAWCDKNWGGVPRPNRTDPVPPELDWDLWIGVAPHTSYIAGIYHPGEWRRWLSYGTGTFGDMGCHIYDPVFEAIGVDAPRTVQSVGPAPSEFAWPNESEVRYTFGGTRFTTDPVSVTWYDGGRRPPSEVRALVDHFEAGQGSIFVGQDGAMILPHVAAPRLYPVAKFKEYKYPQIPTTDHWQQFVNACLGEGKTLAPFNYSGPLTEAVLLGGVAARFPNESLQWDGVNLRFTNSAAANHHLRREYRKGWEVEGLS